MKNKTLFFTLGQKFSYSHWLTKRYLDENNIDGEIRLLDPKNRTEGIIEELVKRYQKNQYNVKAIVPILNTIYGRVKETIGPGRGLIRYRK